MSTAWGSPGHTIGRGHSVTALDAYVDRVRRQVVSCPCGRWFRSATEPGALVLLEHHTRTAHGGAPPRGIHVPPTNGEEVRRMLSTEWQRSTRCSADSPQCVEVRQARGLVQIRDSNDPIGAPLNITRRDWEIFLDGVRDGEFDLH